MKRITRAVLTIFTLIALILSFTSCNIIRKVISKAVSDVASNVATNDENTKLTDEVKSSDGKLSITVPSSWDKKNEDLLEDAVIGVSNLLQEQYVIVINESKADFQDGLTVKEYFNIIKENMSETLTDSIWTEEKDTTVNEAVAYSATVTGVVDKLKIVYWICIVDSGDSISQVLAWTINSKAEANKEILNNVINSFKSY